MVHGSYKSKFVTNILIFYKFRLVTAMHCSSPLPQVEKKRENGPPTCFCSESGSVCHYHVIEDTKTFGVRVGVCGCCCVKT